MAASAYYADADATIYHGNCLDVLPSLEVTPDACVTDPPYGETSAAWDSWPTGWVGAVAAILPASASLWFCGSTRLLLERAPELSGGGWRYAQELLWVKANGSGPTRRDRLVRVHEWAYHWYRGRWGDLHHEWTREPSGGIDKSAVRTPDQVAHRHTYAAASSYVDDGLRQPRSVVMSVVAPSVRGQHRHPTEKPEAVMAALVRECVPPGGLVIDPFAGVGTTALAARSVGRRSVLVESDERYCELAARRLGQQGLFAAL